MLEKEIETEVLQLWDEKEGLVAHAVSYGKEIDEIREEALTDGYGTILENKA